MESIIDIMYQALEKPVEVVTYDTTTLNIRRYLLLVSWRERTHVVTDAPTGEAIKDTLRRLGDEF